ncbi:MAG: hypothetical protein L3J63_06560 [Geopsychrobacter sp.]|nr:hypothetical protein [Geopsychrobacter sp.]
MFVLQKQLSVLNVPSSRVALIYRSGADIQLALPELPSQLGSAYLVMLKGGGKVQVLVGLFMAKSRRNIFYVSDSGEVGSERADRELEAGQTFAESMGFILNDAEFGRLPADQQEAYWKGLPICQRHAATLVEPKISEGKGVAPKPQEGPEARKTQIAAPSQTHAVVSPSVQVATTVSDKTASAQKRRVLKERLGRFLASM